MDPYLPRSNADVPPASADLTLWTVLPRVIAGIDFAIGVGIACMSIDYPLNSLVAVVVTGVVAWGLIQMKRWGWWAGMIFHSAIAAAVSIGYAVLMVLAVRDFGTPPNHMALVTPKGFAAILTILFLVAITVAVVPVLMLRTRRCRITFGVLQVNGGESLNHSRENR